MRIDALTVALRPRSSWEAVELGTALVRRHARAVWAPWLLLTLPAFALINATMYALDMLWLAALLMWWLKPLFARIPLHVLSRAVFGTVPDARTTLREAFRGGGGAMLGYLTWRRLSPARALLMPVDVLEGGPAAQAAERRRVVAGPAYGVAALALVVFFHFEGALGLGIGMLAFVFVPEEHLLGSLQQLWDYIVQSPVWLQLLQNGLAWIATSVIEPFHVGAGFGLYLNRRTEIEGWDIELAFRRLRTRLQAASGALVLALACLLALPVARAADPPAAAATCARPGRVETPLPATFGEDYAPPGSFDRAVARAYADPRISPTRRVTTWKPREQDTGREDGSRSPAWLRGIAGVLGTAGELALWIVAAILLAVLAWTLPRWWPWLRGIAAPTVPKPAAPRETAMPDIEPLPADIAAAARGLWADGRRRDALALVYRGAVEAMVAMTGRALPPGATEAQCLRAAAALPDAPRRAFAHGVRLWQQAAYADRMPADDAFEAMLADAAAQFGWRR
jgi:hypothetical protein